MAHGRDGSKGSRELTITAQLHVTIEANGESACMPIFVQPDYVQSLLSMRVLKLEESLSKNNQTIYTS